MTKVCTFHDGVKDCRFAASLFPVTIGGSNTDILLPDVSPHDGVAYIDFSDKRAFIQPEKRSQVFLNEKQLTESCWLNNGDRVRMGGATVSCAISLEHITFHLLPPSADKTRVLQPPDVKEHQLAVEPQIEISIADSPTASSAQQTKNKLTPKGVILASVFIILLMLTGFVFLATPVTFNIAPEPDTLDVKDGLLSMEMADHFLIWPGKYSVRAEKQGYISLNKTVFIDYGKSVKFDYQLQKLGGILTLSSEPLIGIDVFIDGQSVGKTPVVDIQVSPGQHNIVFKHPRYQRDEQVLEMEGEGKKQFISARLVPNWAIVEIPSQPSAITVKVDNIERGNTPVKLELLAGKHLIRLNKKGFEPWEEEIAVIAGKNQHLPLITLIKSPGILVLSSRPTGVNVLVDRQFKGQTPIKLKLKPELKHKIKLFKAGYEEMTQTVKVESGIEKKIDLQLRAKYGVINLLGMPSDATLYIDGKQQKNNNHSLKLTTRGHKLEVKKAGFQTFITNVTPRSGFPEQVTVKLIPVIQSATPAKALSAAEKKSIAYVKPGRFMMGASRREQGRRSNEVLHEVELTKGFYIGKKEVSNAEYKKFNPYHHSGNTQGLSLDDNLHPVVNVSWDDAAKYCNWLSEQNDLKPVYIKNEGGAMLTKRPLSNGYRLPTEAEWVWASRYAGQSKPLKYPWGQSFPVVNNSGNYASGDQYTVTAPVATFKTNSLGLYDIGGNVSEWVNDYYSVIINSGKSIDINPLGPVTGKHHVIRGSSWRQSSITELRLSYRDYAQDKRSDLGFRVARYAD